jgi:hypothetical protein
VRGVAEPSRHCRAVGSARAEGALHSGLQILRVSTLGIVFMHWVLKDATPRNPQCFGALDVEKSRVRLPGF